MKNFVVCLVVLVGLTASAYAQEFTTAQVLAKIDEKAKAFTTLEAKLTSVQVTSDVKAPPQSGKLLIKMDKSVPRLLWDITEPKNDRMTVLIDKGKFTAYHRDKGTATRKSVDQDNDLLQLLVIGFGMPTATLNKNYALEAKPRQGVGTVQAVVLELRSTTPATAKYPKVTLFLDPETWTPMRTRVAERSGDYTDFNYSDIKLNKNVSDSVFNLKIPSSVK